MAEPHVIAALQTKKAELLGEIHQARARLAALNRDLAVVNDAIALFGHDNAKPLRPIYHPAKGLFVTGEIVRFLFDRIRSHGPQTTVQLKDALLGYKGLSDAETRVRHLVHSKVAKALNRQQARGLLIKDGEVWQAR